MRALDYAVLLGDHMKKRALTIKKRVLCYMCSGAFMNDRFEELRSGTICHKTGSIRYSTDCFTCEKEIPRGNGAICFTHAREGEYGEWESEFLKLEEEPS